MWNRGAYRLIYLGWGLYVVSLGCPALESNGHPLQGWECFVMSFMGCCFPFFGSLNLFFLAGFLVYHSQGGLEREAYGLFLLVSAVVMTGVLLSFGGLLIGAYLWSVSLVTTAIGFALSGAEDTAVHRG
jgi:hypothetical protein